MAGKSKTVYVCSECGAWNTMEEDLRITGRAPAPAPRAVRSFAATPLSQIDAGDEHRFVTGISELDRVLGGGIVKGSVVLLSGDPGIGKSTILLQVCQVLQDKLDILYVSGEESAIQIKLRAKRIGLESSRVSIMTETDVQSVCEYISSSKPELVIVDSIQTMQHSDLPSSPGSITQVRESTNLLLRTGKSLDIPVFIVGHVNKGGDIAGPKVLEHIVDTVLYFEGERNQSYRILRAIKNRFGSTNEIGVFEMTETGLTEVENPSAMMLSGRMSDVSGGCITCIIEGTRPILAEVQGLVAATGFGNARRTATGFDYNRLNLLLAVLEKRLGLYFSNLDTYLNIVGGIRIDEPAADLAVAMSLVSGLRDIPIPDDLVAFGEIGLSGELRSVPRAQARISEAARMGFKKCVLPKSCLKQISSVNDSIELIGVRRLSDAVAVIR